MGAEPSSPLSPPPAARLVKQISALGDSLCQASAQQVCDLLGLGGGSTGSPKHKDGISPWLSISGASLLGQSRASAVTPCAISDSPGKAVCGLIPALGFFHALWLPASPRGGGCTQNLAEQAGSGGEGSGAPTSKKSQP